MIASHGKSTSESRVVGINKIEQSELAVNADTCTTKIGEMIHSNIETHSRDNLNVLQPQEIFLKARGISPEGIHSRDIIELGGKRDENATALSPLDVSPVDVNTPTDASPDKLESLAPVKVPEVVVRYVVRSNSSRDRRELAMTRMMVAIVVAFLACFGPYFLVNIIDSQTRDIIPKTVHKV